MICMAHIRSRPPREAAYLRERCLTRVWLSVLIVTYSLTALGQAALSTPDSPSTFRSDVSLVPVHVVVRDHQGHPIGNLSKDDFQVFDQDKLQVIQQFSAERTGGPASNLAGTAGSTASPEDRFTVYLFDDLHLQHEDSGASAGGGGQADRPPLILPMGARGLVHHLWTEPGRLRG